jgi:DNA-binding HxlR family transcriptional regulator
MIAATNTSDFFSSELDLLGDKWTLLILRDMLFESKSTFTEFRQSKEGIASNILTARLAKLDAAGFVIKTSSTANKVKYQYSLTDKAIELLPTFLTLFAWAEKHGESFHYPNPAYQELKDGTIASINQYAHELRRRRDHLLGL